MSQDARFTLHKTSTHSCGQVIEEIIHLKNDDMFTLALSSPPLPSFSSDYSQESFAAFMASEQLRYTKLQLAGHVERFVINGMEFKDGKLLCLQCGTDLLFPDQGKVSE